MTTVRPILTTHAAAVRPVERRHDRAPRGRVSTGGKRPGEQPWGSIPRPTSRRSRPSSVRRACPAQARERQQHDRSCREGDRVCVREPAHPQRRLLEDQRQDDIEDGDRTGTRQGNDEALVGVEKLPGGTCRCPCSADPAQYPVRARAAMRVARARREPSTLNGRGDYLAAKETQEDRRRNEEDEEEELYAIGHSVPEGLRVALGSLTAHRRKRDGGDPRSSKIPMGIWRNITELVIAETLPSSSPLAKNWAKNWLMVTMDAEARYRAPISPSSAGQGWPVESWAGGCSPGGAAREAGRPAAGFTDENADPHRQDAQPSVKEEQRKDGGQREHRGAAPGR